jgi:uncharacterized protein with PIN domain
VIVDSSGLVAIVLREPGWEALAEKLSTIYVGEDFAKTDLPRA